MTDTMAEEGIALCCATFYQSDLVRALLGDVFHPGGLALTRYLGKCLELGSGDRVLDGACGRGASAVHLAEQFGCHVTGVDYGAENIAAAEAHAAEHRVALLTTFRQGDTEGLPFEGGWFDALISECSFCTFPHKARAAAEMARVLKPGGRLGLTDMTLNGSLPDDIQSLLAWVACVSGAGTPDDYRSALQAVGFVDFRIEDRREALLEMVSDVRRKLLGVELLAGLDGLDLGDVDLKEAKRVARRVDELITDGEVGYTLMVARRA